MILNTYQNILLKYKQTNKLQWNSTKIFWSITYVIKLIDWLLDWCLTPTLGYLRGINWYLIYHAPSLVILIGNNCTITLAVLFSIYKCYKQFCNYTCIIPDYNVLSELWQITNYTGYHVDFSRDQIYVWCKCLFHKNKNKKYHISKFQ